MPSSATHHSRDWSETDLTEADDEPDEDERHRSRVRILLGGLRDCQRPLFDMDVRFAVQAVSIVSNIYSIKW